MTVEIHFDEVVLDWGLFTLGDATGSPEFANTLLRNPGTGIMKVNVVRNDPQHVWNFDFKLVTPSQGAFSDEMDYFNNFWYGGFGSDYGFRVRIETDHIAQAEVLGTSDGTIASRTWRLTRKYNRAGTTTHPYYRYICKPVPGTAHLGGSSVTLYEPNGVTPRIVEQPFIVMLDGVPTTAYTVDNTKGIITLTSTPAVGVIVSWAGQFDTPMRFFSNSFQQKADWPAEIRGIPLVEIMPAELGL